jgi:hypothetical protein
LQIAVTTTTQTEALTLANPVKLTAKLALSPDNVQFAETDFMLTTINA